jgi:hypothetical protein
MKFTTSVNLAHDSLVGFIHPITALPMELNFEPFKPFQWAIQISNTNPPSKSLSAFKSLAGHLNHSIPSLHIYL